MEIVERTDGRLVVEDHSWRTALFLAVLAGIVTAVLLRDSWIVALFFSPGLAIVWTLAWFGYYRATTVFDQVRGTVRRELRRLGRRTVETHEMRDIASVGLRVMRSRRGPAYEPELKRRDGRIFTLSPGTGGSWEQADRLLREIHDVLGSSEPAETRAQRRIRVAEVECPSCGGPLGGRHHEPFAARCTECGATERVRLNSVGEPQGLPDPYPTHWRQIGWWVRAVQELAKGAAICVGACRRCSGPLLAPSDTRIRLRCERCGGYRELPAEAIVAQPLHGLKGHFSATLVLRSFHIEYSIERGDAASLPGHRCPQCGAPVPPGHPAGDCAYCGSRLWLVDADGHRYTYVLAMRGERDGRAVDDRVALSEAEEAISRDAEVFKGAMALAKAASWGVLVLVLMGLAFVVVSRALRDLPGRHAAPWKSLSDEDGAASARLPEPEIDRQALEAHLRMLRLPDESSQGTRHSEALWAIGAMGPGARAAIPQLARFVREGPPRSHGAPVAATVERRLRQDAVRALRGIGPDAYDTLHRLLKDDAAGKHHETILVALVHLADLPPKAVGGGSDGAAERRALQQRLWEQHRPAAIAVLLEAVERPVLRDRAIRELRRLGAFEDIARLLDHREARVRSAACRGLYRPPTMFGRPLDTGDEVDSARAAIPRLTELLEDPDPDVRREAGRTLERLRASGVNPARVRPVP
jgi:hypothetical protein